MISAASNRTVLLAWVSAFALNQRFSRHRLLTIVPSAMFFGVRSFERHRPVLTSDLPVVRANVGRFCSS